jgi:hypothetical protein
MKSVFALLVLIACAQLQAAPCVPDSGHDYLVTTSAQLAQVPFNTLGAGDSVRLAYSPTPFKVKFAINGSDITICGVKGPNGERPILDGSGATTAAATNYGRSSASSVNKSRGLIWIGSKDTDAGVRKPANITVSGLKFLHTRPGYIFDGASAYMDFGAALWVDVGDNVTISDNEFDDVSQAVYTRSQDGTDATVSRATLIAGNRVSNWGIPGDDHEHGVYSESQGIVYEFNWFGPPKAGAGGNPIKDRSAGAVVRYNVTNGGSYSVDLVEAEDFPNIAKADPAYRTTFVYGNIFRTPQLGLHYGGDHAGSEDNYRKGTLYVWNNTFDPPGEPGEGVIYMFRISTTEEHVEAWNNVFYGPQTQAGCDPLRDCTLFVAFRTMQDVAAGYTSGGIVNLGKNTAVPGCPPSIVCDGDPYHPVGGALNGVANLLVAPTKPLDANLAPIAGGKADGTAQAQIAAVAAYPLTQQIDPNGTVSARASVSDIGAIESSGIAPPVCSAMPAVASQDVTCPAGTTGTWTQTHGWNSAPYPSCWTAQAWQPTSPPANRCQPVPAPAKTLITVKQGAASHIFQADGTANAVRQIIIPKAGNVPMHWRAWQGDSCPNAPCDSYDFPNASPTTTTQTTSGPVKATH